MAAACQDVWMGGARGETLRLARSLDARGEPFTVPMPIRIRSGWTRDRRARTPTVAPPETC